jgi:regulator of protease activity HflC (stomatin/prohibitin superfamily)
MRAAAVVRTLVLLSIGFVSLLAGVWYWAQWDRVEPGNVGVLINFRTGEIRSIPAATWVWLDWRNERLIEYPASERSLIMVAKPDEGQVKMDDSVECRTSDRQVLKIDSRSTWRVDPAKIGDLYTSWKDLPLDGKFNADVSTLVVRGLAQGAIVRGCSHYSWEEILGEGRDTFTSTVEQQLREDMERANLKLTRFQLGKVYPAPEIAALLNARLDGQRQAEQARFQQQQAEREGQAAVARAQAEARVAEVKAAQERALALQKAQADADQARIAVEAEAAKVRMLADAEAAANQVRASTLTPTLVEYDRWRRWDGKLPETMLGADPAVHLAR